MGIEWRKLFNHALGPILLLALLFFASQSKAEILQTQGEALAACQARLAATNSSNSAWVICNQQCQPQTHPTYAGGYQAQSFETTVGPPQGQCPSSFMTGGGRNEIFWYLEAWEDCEAGEAGTNTQTGVIGDIPLGPSLACDGHCEYQRTSQQNCFFEDTNQNGIEDPGEPAHCIDNMVSTGYECTTGGENGLPGMNPPPDDPGAGDPPTYDCTNVDCSSDPDDGGGTGNDDSGDPVDPQDPPGTPGNGDGDPDTPDGPGEGTGDTNGDDEREVDCNPASNRDCAYTGSGNGVGDCDSQPSCTGDPVQCAILYQNWAAMCFDPGEFTNPSSCTAEFQCEGDVLACESIRQERQQYCDAYVGVGIDTDVTNDQDFDRDLRDEAEEINVEGMLDTAGWGYSGSCPAPFSFTAYGRSFQISLEPFCEIAPIIRALVIMASLLSALFIVTGTGKKS